MRVFRFLLAVAGAALIGWGVYGMLHDPYIRDPSDVLVWAVSGVLIHDALWMPLVLLVGTPLVRHPVLRGGLITAAALTAAALPAVLRTGQNHGNATLLPLPYLHNWVLLLAVVAVLTVLTAMTAFAVRSLRRRPPAGHPAPSHRADSHRAARR